MIKAVEQVASPKDWELSIINGNLIVKLSRGKSYEFRRTLALKFFEELETLLRPTLFQIKEGEGIDFSNFLDELNSLHP